MQHRTVRRRCKDFVWNWRENKDATKCFLWNGGLSAQEKWVRTSAYTKNIKRCHCSAGDNGPIVHRWYKYDICLILQVVPPSGSWKRECDSSQQAIQVSNDHKNKCVGKQSVSSGASLDSSLSCDIITGSWPNLRCTYIEQKNHN